MLLFCLDVFIVFVVFDQALPQTLLSQACPLSCWCPCLMKENHLWSFVKIGWVNLSKGSVFFAIKIVLQGDNYLLLNQRKEANYLLKKFKIVNFKDCLSGGQLSCDNSFQFTTPRQQTNVSTSIRNNEFDIFWVLFYWEKIEE